MEPAEQVLEELEEVEVEKEAAVAMAAVAMAAAGTYLIVNGALPVTCPLWLAPLVGQPGRRYDATLPGHSMSEPEGMRSTHATWLE